MIRLLTFLLTFLLAGVVSAAQIISVSPASDGLSFTLRVTKSYAVNDFSAPINGCPGMTVASRLGKDSVVSLYSTHEASTTLAAIESSPFIGTISVANPNLGSFTPHLQQVRLVVDTQSTGTHGGVVTVTCDAFDPLMSSTFYGLPTHFGANTIQEHFDFNVLAPYIFEKPAVPGSLDSGITGPDPWRTILSDAPTGTLGEVQVKNSTAGDIVLHFHDDIIDNLSMNVTNRGPIFFLNEIEGNIRKAVVEFRMGQENMDDSDMYIGTCTSAQKELLNTDGTLAGSMHAGFHWSRGQANGFPTLTSSGGAATPLATPTLPDLADDTSVFGGFRRYAIKFLGQTELEWYIDDVMVGKKTLTSGIINFEQSICLGMVTTGGAVNDMWVDHIKWVVDKLE